MAKSSPSPVFQFHSHHIRTVVKDSQPWFAAKDVCVALDIDWSGKTLAAIPDAWQSMGKLPTLRRGDQQLKLISEPAVYKLAFRSNKPEADAFTNWVASEVLPTIRKTGTYEALPQPKQKQLPLTGESLTFRIKSLLNDLDALGAEMITAQHRKIGSGFVPNVEALRSDLIMLRPLLTSSSTSLEALVEFSRRLYAC